MESSRIHILVIVLASVLAVSASSLGNRREDINHLVTLLGKMQHMARTTKNTVPTSVILDITKSGEASPNFPASLDSESSNSFRYEESPLSELFAHQAGSVNKRQGGWSYDYGLGGGRFGKRNYGDYGIGGGRFGRDVDHVDLADGNEAEMAL